MRSRGELLTAVQTTVRASFPFGDRRLTAQPGDWIIRAGDQVIDVVRVLDSDYEIVLSDTLVVPQTLRQQLERILGIGTTNTPEDLLKAVDLLARLEIGGVLVDFTPAQWTEMKRKAEVQNQPLSVYLQRLVQKLTQDLWSV